MKKVLLSLGLLLTASVSAQVANCSQLFISEYVEGKNNNKALEIYNPTNQAIDLSQYMVIRYSNGASAGSVGAESAVQLTGTIQPYDVHVAVLDKRNPAGMGQDTLVYQPLMDLADAFYSPDYNVSKAMYFNGNDAVVLAKGLISNINGSQLIDIFGKIGEDPATGFYMGWTNEFPYVGVGVEITKDYTLIRRPSVQKGEINVSISHFNALAEWDTIAAVTFTLDGGGAPVYHGSFSTLGSHDCACNPLSVNNETELKLSIYPNPSATGEFSFSSESNIVNVEVYSVVGQKVFSQENNSGIQSINIGKQPGVYLINLRTASGVVTSRRVIVK